MRPQFVDIGEIISVVIGVHQLLFYTKRTSGSVPPCSQKAANYLSVERVKVDSSRAHFSKERKNSPLDLTVNEGDIFHVTDTLFGGTVGLWQAARVYSSATNKGDPPNNKGVIPNQVSYFQIHLKTSIFRLQLRTWLVSKEDRLRREREHF